MLRVTANIFRDRLENDSVCLSISTIYKSLLSVLTGSIRVNTFLLEIGGLHNIFQALLQHIRNRAICENFIFIAESVATLLNAVQSITYSEFIDMGLGVVNKVMEEHKVSRRISKSCVSILKSLTADKGIQTIVALSFL